MVRNTFRKSLEEKDNRVRSEHLSNILKNLHKNSRLEGFALSLHNRRNSRKINVASVSDLYPDLVRDPAFIKLKYAFDTLKKIGFNSTVYPLNEINNAFRKLGDRKMCQKKYETVLAENTVAQIEAKRIIQNYEEQIRKKEFEKERFS